MNKDKRIKTAQNILNKQYKDFDALKAKLMGNVVNMQDSIENTLRKREQVMTPDHPDWDDFIERMYSDEGCNVEMHLGGDITWTCGGGEDKTFATKILKSYPNISVGESLKFFEEHGGYCDCEILMNVEDSYEYEKEKKSKAIGLH